MNSEKMTFYDSEIFDYGMKSGSFINESTCPLSLLIIDLYLLYFHHILRVYLYLDV